jgi:hypothetical protein
MTTQQITILLYARAFERDDLRPHAAVQAIEAVLPSEKMRYEIDHEGSLVALDDLDARLATALKDGDMPLLCNGNEHAPASTSWLPIPAILGPKQTALSSTMVQLRQSPLFLGATEDLLGRLGDALVAFWGVATPDPSASVIGSQLSPQNLPLDIRTFPPGGLPSLQPLSELPGPEIPERLGWINYFSAPTATILGFPDAERDAAWLRRARRTDAGAWLVRLTDEPLLVPDNEEHLAALKAAYERFLEAPRR